MLRGTYASGSLNVTARCPCATTASVSAYAFTAPSSGLSQARPRRHPACPRPGSRPAKDASQHRFHRYAPRRSAEQCPRHSRLCYSSAFHCCALPSHGEAEQSKAFASHDGSLLRRCHASPRIAGPFPRSAERCCSVASRCCSVLRRRGALHSKAVAHQVVAQHFLRLATPCYAVAQPITAPPFLRPAVPFKAMPSQHVSVHRRCIPRLCFAVASRCSALRCRRRSRHLMAELPNASVHRFVAGPSRGRSLRCSSLADHRTALLRRRLGAALPCSSFADLGSAVHFRRRAGQIKALPSQLSA